MSWLSRAFTTLNNDPDAYYAAISPPEFYEWRFMRAVPKGAQLHRKMPRSDVFTENKVIASATLSRPDLIEKGGAFEVKETTPATVVLTVGQILSPVEVIAKFARLQENYERSLGEFKRLVDTQRYFTSLTDDPQLYRVAKVSEDEVDLFLLGTVTDTREKLAQVLDDLNKLTYKKKGRAYEMETYRRFENYMTSLENSTVQIDASKMEYLLTTAQIKPIQTRTIPWSQCFIEVSADAQELRNRLDLFNSLNWVKHSRKNIFLTN